MVLDVSGSMRGDPIKAVNAGIKTLVDTLSTDPYALETAFLSIIKFNNVPEQLVPLTEVYAFNPPELKAEQGTYIGKALKLLAEVIDREVIKNTVETKGDWKPIVFLMTDGRSGDSISKAMSSIDRNKLGFIVACATGSKSNVEALKEITENVVMLENLDSETISTFFKWVSASVASRSASIENSNTDVLQLEELPPLPQIIILCDSNH